MPPSGKANSGIGNVTLHPGIYNFQQLLQNVRWDPLAPCIQVEPGWLSCIVPGSPVAASVSEFQGRWSVGLSHVPLRVCECPQRPWEWLSPAAAVHVLLCLLGCLSVSLYYKAGVGV